MNKFPKLATLVAPAAALMAATMFGGAHAVTRWAPAGRRR